MFAWSLFVQDWRCENNSQTCIKRSPLGEIKSGLIRHTSIYQSKPWPLPSEDHIDIVYVILLYLFFFHVFLINLKFLKLNSLFAECKNYMVSLFLLLLELSFFVDYFLELSFFCWLFLELSFFCWLFLELSFFVDYF